MGCWAEGFAASSKHRKVSPAEREQEDWKDRVYLVAAGICKEMHPDPFGWRRGCRLGMSSHEPEKEQCRLDPPEICHHDLKFLRADDFQDSFKHT